MHHLTPLMKATIGFAYLGGLAFVVIGVVLSWQRRRLHLTPGMTGPWQILGSTRVPLGEMVKMDYLYIANWSLLGDVRIILRTVLHVVGRSGL